LRPIPAEKRKTNPVSGNHTNKGSAPTPSPLIQQRRH
jgi:hypothetical protein